MTHDEFIEELQNWKEKLRKEVISHFQIDDKERGRLAFERWKKRFIEFLKKYAPNEANNFIRKTIHFAMVGKMNEHPYSAFMRQDGNLCNAFIEDLIDAVSDGYVEIAENDLSKDSPEHPKENSLKPQSKTSTNMQIQIDSKNVFIVHGQDNEAKESVARFLQKLDLEPIKLHELPNAGKTIIEKFEHHSNEVGYAVVLLTPDDLGRNKNNKMDLQPRARQNVIFELGYFSPN